MEGRAENIPAAVGATLTHRLLMKELKDLRVSVDSLFSSQDGLVRLLIEKGLLTLDEYQESMTGAAEREADRRCAVTVKEHGLPEGTTFA